MEFLFWILFVSILSGLLGYVLGGIFEKKSTYTYRWACPHPNDSGEDICGTIFSSSYEPVIEKLITDHLIWHREREEVKA